MQICFCHVWLFETPWTVAYQVPLSMECSKKNTGVGCHFLLPGDLPHPGVGPACLVFPALAGGFYTTEPPGLRLPNKSTFSQRWPTPFVSVNKVLFTSFMFIHLPIIFDCWHATMVLLNACDGEHKDHESLTSLPPTSQTVTRAILQNHVMHIVSPLPKIFLNSHCSLVNLTFYESLNPLTPSHLYLWWPLSCDTCDSSVAPKACAQGL